MRAATALQVEDEGVTSGFSSRPLSLSVPPSLQPWPAEQLPPTPHKRVAQTQAAAMTSLAAGPGGSSGAPSMAPPPFLWSPEEAPKWSSLPAGGPLAPGGALGQTPEQPPTPHKRAGRGGGGLEREREREREWLVGGYGGGGRETVVKMKRSPSMPRSPTITKEISSLADLSQLSGHGNGACCNEQRWLDLQPLLPAILVTIALLLWCLRSLSSPTFTFWIFPDDFVTRSWLKLFVFFLLIAFAALLLRLLYPSFIVLLRTPDIWQLNFNLQFNLSGLRKGLWPVLRRGVRYFHFTAKKDELLGYYQSKKGYYKSGKPSSGHGLSWQAGSVFSSPPARQNSLIMSGGSRKVESPKVTGCGVHTYSNGDRYEGEFYQGKCSGSGVYYFALSGRYEGDWVDGKYDGYGVETWSRGSRYRGQYRQGLRDGYGVYRFYTGDVYSGLWSKGQSHGVGSQTCADGSRYVGEFAWGSKHGYGKYIFRNGDVYSGEYFADKMHGFGVYVFANGHRYEGAWHEARKQGLGCYTFRNGETRAGHWNKGALETRSTHSATSASATAVNHSRVLHAVQEARRAASKAENVMLVEDRVSKAVAGANRSAVAARVAAVKATQQSSGGKLAEP